MASSIESSEKILISCFFDRLLLAFLPTVGLGSETVEVKKGLGPSSAFLLGDTTVSISAHNRTRFGGRGSEIVGARAVRTVWFRTGCGAD
jgi:hypothetical protein